MKRKYIIFICTAALLLSGCKADSSSKVNVFSTNGTVSASSSTKSTAVSSSASKSTTESSSSTSTASSSFSKSEASSAETSQPVSSTTSDVPPASSVISETSDVPAPPEIETQTIVYSHDPKNACTITFDGASIIVRGKSGDLLSGISDDYPKLSVESSTDGDETVYTLTPKNTSFGQR